MRPGVLGRVLLAIIAVISVSISPTPAIAQSNCFAGVDFAPLDNNFSGPSGISGVSPIAVGGVITRLNLDQNADGLPDMIFDLPVVAQDAVNYFLSPGQRFVIATAAPLATNCGGIGGPNGPTGIVIMRVPTSGTMLSVVHTDCLPGGLLNGNGRWYESGLCTRNLQSGACTTPANRRPNQVNCNGLFIARSNDGASQFYRIYNLLDTTPDATDGRATFTARRCVEDNRLTIDVGGSYMVVNHDLPCLSPTTSDLELVSVCPSSSSFGQVAAVLVNDGSVSGSQTFARVAACSGDNLEIQFFLQGTLNRSFSLPRCCGAIGVPSTGSCCTVSGTCSVTTAEACPPGVGTFTLGATCTPNPCVQPRPILSITKSASAPSVVAAENFTYTLTATNSGFAAAQGTQIVDSLPSGTTFVSGSDSPSVFGQSVTWNIGTLGPQTSVTRTVTVTALCGFAGGSVTNQSYSVRANFVTPVNGSPVTTMVTPRPVPVGSLAVSAVASRSGPLFPGDTITYTIDLSNPGPLDIQNGLLAATAGMSSEAIVDSIVSAGVGIAQINFGSGSLNWRVSLPAGATTRLEFVVRIAECLPSDAVQTRLNQGRNIMFVDPCFAPIAQVAAPAALAVIKPVTLAVGLDGPIPGVVSPLVTGGVFEDAGYQALRAGSSAVFRARLTNNLPTPVASAEMTLSILEGIDFGTPPLAEPIPPGVSFDASTRTVSFSGAIAPGAPVDVLVNLVAPVQARNRSNCRVRLSASAGTTDCTNAFQDLFVLFVPAEPVPPVPGLMGVDESGGLWRHLASASPETVCCLPTEIFYGLGRAPNGDVWIAGLPSFMINPGSLDLHVVGAPFVGPFTSSPTDVAVTPDGSVYFIGSFSVIEGMIVRYDRSTDTYATVLRDGLLREVRRIVALPDGRLVFQANSGRLYALDPQGPLPKTFGQAVEIPRPLIAQPQCALFAAPDSSTFGAFALDPAGDLSVLIRTNFPQVSGPNPVRQATVTSLLSVEPTTLQHVVVDPAFSYSFNIFGQGELDPCVSGFHTVAGNGSDAMMIFDNGDIAVNDVASSNRYFRASLLPAFSVATINTGIGFDPNDLEAIRVGSAQNPCDFDGNGVLDPDDLADFIAAYFVVPSDPRADFNHDGLVDPDDLADYIAAYFGGC